MLRKLFKFFKRNKHFKWLIYSFFDMFICIKIRVEKKLKYHHHLSLSSQWLICLRYTLTSKQAYKLLCTLMHHSALQNVKCHLAALGPKLIYWLPNEHKYHQLLLWGTTLCCSSSTRTPFVQCTVPWSERPGSGWISMNFIGRTGVHAPHPGALSSVR